MRPVLLFFLLLCFFPSLAQEPPRNYFRPPLDTAISLAGNFGEIRPNHFHAGFDFRTNNREGLSVYAAAEGYVSRIKISPYGYGKALYITHPNGYSTVYGHLSGYAWPLDTIIRNMQYSLQSFEIDTLLAPGTITLKKGQLIAFTGNTGGSQGPHLHFEVRESKTEMPMNPYLFGFEVPDTIPPRFTLIAIYPLSGNSLINGKSKPKILKPVYKKGTYSFAATDTLAVSGAIGFGAECYDTESGSVNRNGVYSLELQSGGKRIYYYEMRKFSFENSRYVNAHIDYPRKYNSPQTIQRCYLTENNQAGIYKDVLNSGALNFNDTAVHWIRFIAKDYNGNSTELMLKVRGRANMAAEKELKKEFQCEAENTITGEEIKVIIPSNALYEDADRKYSRKRIAGYFSSVHEVMEPSIALQKSITISLKAISLPETLNSKVCVVRINEKGKKLYEGGSFENGWVSVRTKSFGSFAVSIDTIAPRIKPAFVYKPGKEADLRRAGSIGVRCSDDLSGIRKYRGLVDGRWVLCEYETKKDLIFYTFDKNLTAGSHTFEIEVTDDKGNVSRWTCRFKK